MGMRDEFEVWALSEGIKTYYSHDHQDVMTPIGGACYAAWKAATAAYERKYAASQIVPAKCSPDCTHKVSDGPGVCMSAFCLMKFDEERMDIIGQNGNDGEHYKCSR